MHDLAAALRGRRAEAAGLALATGVLCALAAQGSGWFPPAWSWATLAVALCTVPLLLARPAARPSRAGLALAGGLALLSAWSWLSTLWSRDPDSSLLEGQRTLLYAVAALAAVLLVRRGSLPWIAGLLVALTAGIAADALSVRLFPERFGVYDPVSENRISEPLGYWNGLGLALALGTVLALGAVAHARHPLARAGAAATAVLATTAMYFTFSRGAWAALALALLVALAAPGRLRVAGAALLVGVPCAAAVGLSTLQEALKTRDAALEQASLQGHRLALFVALVAVAAAGLGWAAGPLARALQPGPGARRALHGALAAAFAAAVAAVLVAGHGPVRLVHRAADSFTAAPTNPGSDVSKRLASFNGSYRAEMWRVAGHAVAEEPALGIGAGAYSREWLAKRPVSYRVTDAHSLYLEALAELGPVGLVLLVLALGAPLAAARRALRTPLGGVALGAYVAFLAHAAIDWDWELPYLVGCALLLGAGLVAAGGRERPAAAPAPARRARPSRRAVPVVALLLACAGAAAYLLPGNLAFDSAEAALHEQRPAAAVAPAADAVGWQPWSARALAVLGEAQLLSGSGDARATLRRAVAADPKLFEAWLYLAAAEIGRARTAALARARALDPFVDLSGFQQAG